MRLDKAPTVGSARASLLPAINGTLLVICLWLLLHPYAGIIHDARLYTAQALWHLQPSLYQDDIFFKFGTQDRYTFFSPIYATLINHFGIEHAAAMITATSQIAFLIACWLVARRLYEPVCAIFVAALVLIIPGNYGSDFVFTYFEPFVTPRLVAEALTLFGLLALSSNRRKLAIACGVSAALFHPIMTMAGIVFVACYWSLRHPRGALSIVVLSTAAVTAMAVSRFGVSLRIDPEWLSIIERRSPYLFLRNWMYADWARVSVPICTLILGILTYPKKDVRKRLSNAALLVGIFGLFVNLVACDLLAIVIATQGQAWRWLWLTTLISLLLSPATVTSLWRRNNAGKASGLLLVTAWLVRNEGSALGLSILAMAAGYMSHHAPLAVEKYGRYLLNGSYIVAGCMALWMLGMNWLNLGLFPNSYLIPHWLDLTRDSLSDGLLCLAACGGVYWAAAYYNQMWNSLIAATLAVILVVLSRFMIPIWFNEEYSASTIQSMEPWRNIISPSEQVLWLEGTTPTWLALQRPSYISGIQTTITLFSRAAAFEAQRRADQVTEVFPNEHPLDWTFKATPELTSTSRMQSLKQICDAIPVNFIVSNKELDTAPLFKVPKDLPVGYQSFSLYQCPSS